MTLEWLFDSAVFLYAVGGEHAYRVPCQRLVAALGDGRVRGHVSAELLQEFAHVRSRRDNGASSASLTRAIASISIVHALERDDVLDGLALFEAHPRLSVRDGLHAATALRRGLSTIVTADRAFDDVPGLSRIDPIDAARQLEGDQ